MNTDLQTIVQILGLLQEYAARSIGVDFYGGAVDFSDRNMKWIQCLAARLNVRDVVNRRVRVQLEVSQQER